MQRLQAGVGTEGTQLLLGRQARASLVVGPQHAISGAFQDTHNPAGWEVARRHQSGVLSDSGREVADAQLRDPAVDQ